MVAAAMPGLWHPMQTQRVTDGMAGDLSNSSELDLVALGLMMVTPRMAMLITAMTRAMARGKCMCASESKPCTPSHPIK